MNLISPTQIIGKDAIVGVTGKKTKKYSAKSVLTKRGLSGKGYC